MTRIKPIRTAVIFTLLCSLVLLCAGMTGVHAAAKGRLTIDSKSANIPVTDMHWQVFRVADVPKGDTLELTGAFAGLPVKPDLSTEDGARTAASTLEAYAVAYGITPDFSAVASSDGTVTAENLEPGYYLVLGEPLKDENGMYLSVPTLLCIADGGQYDNPDWSLDRTIVPKIRLVSGAEYHSQTDRTVQKIWVNADKTPEIRVRLYRDGTLYDTQTLNDANNWEYTWSKLDNPSRWTVIEEQVPGGCTVSYTQQQVKSGKTYKEAFIITNTGSTTVVTTSRNTGSNNTGKLPQTGQLWWPIPLLVLGGSGLLALGWRITRKKRS